MKYIKELNKEKINLKGKQVILYLFLIFLIGAMIGWVYEEIFYFFEDGLFVNRGFLYGPYLPVYGWGSLLIILLLKPFKKSPIVFFLATMLITGILEYFTGIVMWEIWHQKWWDYTGLFLNIDGYVCLRSVLTFAVAGMGLIYIIEPLLKRKIDNDKRKILSKISILLFLLFLIDNIITFAIRH